MTESGLYAYTIAPSDLRLDHADIRNVPGIDDRPLDLVTRHDLAVVVSPVDFAVLDVDEEDLSDDGALARLARRHDEVIRAVFEQAPVLPLRFGTLVRDHAAAAELIDDRHGQISAVLGRLRDRREWGVRLRRTGPAPSADARHESRSHAATDARSGAAYLAQRSTALRAVDAARERERDLIEGLVADLEPYVDDSARRRARQGGVLLLDMAYLVERSREDDFLDVAERLATQAAPHGFDLETTGPWPPYAFAHLAFTEAPA